MSLETSMQTGMRSPSLGLDRSMGTAEERLGLSRVPVQTTGPPKVERLGWAPQYPAF